MKIVFSSDTADIPLLQNDDLVLYEVVRQLLRRPFVILGHDHVCFDTHFEFSQ